MMGLMILLFEADLGSGVGGVAQLGEHLLCKQGVIGSIPIVSTTAVCAANSGRAAVVCLQTMRAQTLAKQVARRSIVATRTKPPRRQSFACKR
jgi:hypothetical protein